MRAQRAILIVAVLLGIGYFALRGGFAGLGAVRGARSGPAAARTAVDRNATSLPVRPAANAPPEASTAQERLDIAIFASGCFWCTEADFDKLSGVLSTTSGYTGGHVVNPTYEQVSAGGTGHVESVEIQFDPSIVSYEMLLDHYWHNVDPFTTRGQFCDFGEQYRPVIFVRNAAQRAAAEASKRKLQERFSQPIVVSIEDAAPFYAAEAYHQDFHTKSSVRYNYYRWGCGRDARLAEIWRKGT